MNTIRRLFQNIKKSPGGSTINIHEGIKVEKPKFGFSNAPAEWREMRENHYRRWLGGSERAFVWHELLPLVPHVDIHVFHPSRELGRNFYALITSGMSDEKMFLPDDIDGQYSRAEIIFYVSDVEWKEYETKKPWFVQYLRQN